MAKEYTVSLPHCYNVLDTIEWCETIYGPCFKKWKYSLSKEWKFTFKNKHNALLFRLKWI
jgi:hypothetical protein